MQASEICLRIEDETWWSAPPRPPRSMMGMLLASSKLEVPDDGLSVEGLMYLSGMESKQLSDKD